MEASFSILNIEGRGQLNSILYALPRPPYHNFHTPHPSARSLPSVCSMSMLDRSCNHQETWPIRHLLNSRPQRRIEIFQKDRGAKQACGREYPKQWYAGGFRTAWDETWTHGEWLLVMWQASSRYHTVFSDFRYVTFVFCCFSMRALLRWGLWEIRSLRRTPVILVVCKAGRDGLCGLLRVRSQPARARLRCFELLFCHAVCSIRKDTQSKRRS